MTSKRTRSLLDELVLAKEPLPGESTPGQLPCLMQSRSSQEKIYLVRGYMVRSPLPRGLDGESFRLAMGVEDPEMSIEAAFWKLQHDGRWILHLVTDATSNLGPEPVLGKVREQIASKGYGKDLFDVDDIRPIGLKDEEGIRVRLDHYGVRGRGFSFSGTYLILWTHRTPPQPLLSVPLESEDGQDTGFVLTMTPASIRTIGLAIVGPQKGMIWKGTAEVLSLTHWLSVEDDETGTVATSAIRLASEGDQVACTWQRGHRKGYVSRSQITEPLSDYQKANQVALGLLSS